MHASIIKTTIDVRNIIPRERHPLVSGSFLRLAPGESIMLINDHDPRLLFYEFRNELGENFFWDYVEKGPEIWQVQIGKTTPCHS
jgi:uncharacterized protein (DUF2249 family)